MSSSAIPSSASRAGSPNSVNQIHLGVTRRGFNIRPTKDYLYRSALLEEVLTVKNKDDQEDAKQEINLKTMETQRVKVKTLLKKEIASLDVRAYNQLASDAIKKITSYAKTLVFFTKRILKEDGQNKYISATFDDVEYDFSTHDITHIQALYLAAVSNVKIIFRSSKKTVRKQSAGSSSGTAGRILLSQPFQHFFSGFINTLQNDINTHAGNYMSLSKKNTKGVPVNLVSKEKVQAGIQNVAYFNSPESLIKRGYADKLAVRTVIYIAAYISNIDKLRNTSIVSNLTDVSNPQVVQERNRLRSLSIDELKAEKRRFLGGKFSAPPYMQAAFGRGANWDPKLYPFGRVNYNHATCVITDAGKTKTTKSGVGAVQYKLTPAPTNQRTVFEEMSQAPQTDSNGRQISFDPNEISMNLVNRIVSLVTISPKALKSTEGFVGFDRDPTVVSAFNELNRPDLSAPLDSEIERFRSVNNLYHLIHSYYAFSREQSLRFITGVIASKKKKAASAEKKKQPK